MIKMNRKTATANTSITHYKKKDNKIENNGKLLLATTNKTVYILHIFKDFI